VIRAAIAAVLFAPLSTTQGAAQPAPDPRLAAFEAACLDGYRNPEIRAAVIAAAGWSPVADNVDPALGRLMAISREAMVQSEEEDGFAGSISAYGRRLAGGEAYLVTTELDMAADAGRKIDLLGCYLYDFAADAPLPVSLITFRFDERPAEVVDQPGVIVAQVWNIERIEGVWELRSTFIPPGSPAAGVTGFTGLAISLTSTSEG
jgi:hypothetical protein